MHAQQTGGAAQGVLVAQHLGAQGCLLIGGGFVSACVVWPRLCLAVVDTVAGGRGATAGVIVGSLPFDGQAATRLHAASSAARCGIG